MTKCLHMVSEFTRWVRQASEPEAGGPFWVQWWRLWAWGSLPNFLVNAQESFLHCGSVTLFNRGYEQDEAEGRSGSGCASDPCNFKHPP